MPPNRLHPFAALAATITLLASVAFGSVARADGGVCAQPDYSVGLRVEGQDNLSLSPEALAQKIIVEADSATMTRGGLSQLMGGVKLRQGDKEFSAESIDFQDSQQLITVNTESVFTNPQFIIRSQQAQFNLVENSGAFSDTDFVLPARSARGTSGRITLSTDGRARLEQTAYTTCAPNSDAWYIEAADIRLDREEGLGTARHARLRFGGVPVLYVPWFQFPIDDRRRTGLLFPTMGESDNTGFDFRWPVYLNLGPNYDATVTPRLMTDRGLQLGSSARYLMAHGEGALSYDYLDNDRVYGDDRSLLRFDHVGLLAPHLGVEATFAEVSDPRYFEDLGGSLANASIVYLERSARLTYQAPDSYRVQALVQGFQTIDNGLTAVDDPYKRLPQIRLDALTRNAVFNTRAGISAEYVNFVREDSIQGQRIDLQPYLRYLVDENAWYLTSQVDWRYTHYELTDTPSDQPESPSRSLPVVSAETGLRFERITESGAIQTLEPRGFALYVPYEDQDDLPLFDTGEPDFDFVQLFARNRFYGEDRVADAANIAGALTTRLIDPVSGETRWKASFGQLYRIESPRVDLPDVDAPDRGATDFIGEVGYSFVSRWSANATAQWSPEESKLERSNLALRYRNPDDGKRLDLAFRDRRGLLQQTDVQFSWPVSNSWRVAGRSRYSLRDDKTLEHFVGLTYETCCWALSAAYRRYIASSSGDLDSGIYLQLQLKGLTRIGTGYSSLLPSDAGEEINDSGRPSSRLTGGRLNPSSSGTDD
jgi:LPS-assembly protein